MTPLKLLLILLKIHILPPILHPSLEMILYVQHPVDVHIRNKEHYRVVEEVLYLLILLLVAKDELLTYGTQKVEGTDLSRVHETC